MRALLAVLFSLIVGSAQAQTPQAQIDNSINTLIADGQNPTVSPSNLRAVLHSMNAATYQNLISGSPGDVLIAGPSPGQIQDAPLAAPQPGYVGAVMSNNFLYGSGCNAAALGVIGNRQFPAFACQIAYGTNWNGFADGPASYLTRPQVGLYVQLNSSSGLFSANTFAVSGFTLTTVTLSSALSVGDLGKIRPGMAVNTNDATPFSGVIASINAAGTVITVSGWYQWASATTPCMRPCTAGTPSGTSISINQAVNTALNKLFASNIIAIVNAGDIQQSATAQELDCYNATGSYNSGTDVPHVTCLDIVNAAGNSSSTAGITFTGQFANGATYLGAASNAAFHVNPGGNSVAIGFSSRGATEALRMWDASGNIQARIFPNSGAPIFDLGQQAGSAANATLRFYSSANAATGADATMIASAGTGNADGTLTWNAGSMVFQMSGNAVLTLQKVASSVTSIRIDQNTTGQPPKIRSIGETNTSLLFKTNGTGSHLFQPGSDTATAFVIQNAAGTLNYLVVDTSGGTVNLPQAATGTPVASLCLDASNHIIKKTTTGSCI
jgi:hypothetical protein